jgi:hypothetical protein
VSPLLAVAAALLAAASGDAGRTMSWRLLDVEARLDARGDLHVRERQEIVFDGAWNGGERTFRVGPRQRLRFEGIVRVAPGGDDVPLAPGKLSRVDEYQLSGNTLRWRSRLPSDPPFSRDVLVYVLEYTLSGVLQPEGDGRYVLRHDFAFPDRAWPIAAARARLEVDRSWRDESLEPLELRAGALAPGESFVMTVPVRWSGAGSPPSMPGDGISTPLRGGLALAFLGALGIAAIALHRHGAARGQFAPPPRPDQVDDAFLREHVLSRRPEVVGAAWDDSVGAPEVAAVLARMEAEGKLATRLDRRGAWVFKRDVLELALRVRRETLEGYERDLVEGIFVEGDTIDADRLRRHYRKRGFDPSAKIRWPLLGRVRHLAPEGERPPLAGPLAVAGALLAAAAAAGAISAVREGFTSTLPAAVVLPLGAGVIAARFRRRATRLAPFAVTLAAYLVLWALGVLWLAAGGALATPLVVAAHALSWAAGVVAVFAIGRTPLGPEAILLRKRLAAARAHLARELDRESPRLDDAWTPYLLAFGLGPDMDRWVRVHRRDHVHASRSVSSGGGSSWTGGGGSFSGGGASGTWAALGGIAASIPSAASRGGGGGGGGSSSGGGGGGGW